ncbi:MAG TPA: class I SAM-dependent methyltransferase [Anaerolineales bacterium]|nr:class I SAM-dependent methyltransferase [Anaerolineales bacterium]
MDRADWIREKRHEAEERYDLLWAPEYSEKWGVYSNASHQQFIQKFLSLLPPHSTILDAACGAGRYMPALLEKKHMVFGIDQAQGMLTRVREKFPAVQVEKIGLQEMSHVGMFDGVICMDAMEHIFPEDWVLVVDNFHRALKPQGHLYFTVEIGDSAEIEQAFAQGRELGLPVVHGELPEADGVYHYYPSMEQVRMWSREAGFEPIAEGEGDGYHHFVWRRG